MTDQVNVFDGVAPAPIVVADPTITPDPFADKLKLIVGTDGKPKYANASIALDALAASQAHIARLEAEKAQERVEIDRLREVERNARSLEEVARRLENPPEKVTPAAGLDEQTISELVTRTLENRDRQSAAQANVERVNATLIEKYKDKTKEIVAAKAAELGMTPQELGVLSSQKPALVLQLFGSIAAPAASPTSTSVHLPGNPPISEGVKKPDYSIISGINATDKNRKALMAEIRADVHKRLGVTT